MQKSKVSTKGQVVIPKEFRDIFSMKPGSRVMIEAIEEGVLIMPLPRRPLKMMRGLFKGKFRKSSVELIRELREEWDKKLGI